MEVSYKFTPKEIQKLSKFKNPSIILRKENIVKNEKYKFILLKICLIDYLKKNNYNMFLLINENHTSQIKLVMDWVRFSNLYYHMLLNLERSFYLLLE